MITSEERKDAFELELKALLKKHNTELSIELKDDRFGIETPYMVAIMSTVMDEQHPNEILEDFKICRMGAKCGVILNDNQKLRNFKVVVYNKNLINIIKESLYAGWNKNILNISTPYIVKDDIYKYIEKISYNPSKHALTNFVKEEL